MNHQENQEHMHMEEKECCGAGCCDTDMCVASKGEMVAVIVKRILMIGAFGFSLATLILLPRMIRKELVKDQAIKAGGVENYDRLNSEIYNTPEYKDYMKQQVDLFIQENKARIEATKGNAQGQSQQDMIRAMMAASGAQESQESGKMMEATGNAAK